MQRDDATLVDLAQASERIAKFLAGTGREAFLTDELVQSAVLHQLLVVGEAAKRLSSEFRAAHPEMPWTDMAGMRDKLIHEYDVVDIEEVWLTATRDISALLAWLQGVLPAQQP